MTSYSQVENSKPKCQTAISGGQQRHQKIPLGNSKWMLTVRQPSCRSLSSRGRLGFRVKPCWLCRRWWWWRQYYRIYSYLYPNILKNSHTHGEQKAWCVNCGDILLKASLLLTLFVIIVIIITITILLWRESDSKNSQYHWGPRLILVDFDRCQCWSKRRADRQIGHPQGQRHGKKITKNHIFYFFPSPSVTLLFPVSLLQRSFSIASICREQWSLLITGRL